MWKRAIPWVMMCSLAALFLLAGRQTPANHAADKDAPPAAPAAAKAVEDGMPPGVKIAASHVLAVTVYPNSALVTREVEVPAGMGTHELTVTPLPPTTNNTSLYTEGTDGIRVLTTRFRTRQILEDTREDVRKLQDEIKQLQRNREELDSELKALQANSQTISKMEGFMAVTTVHATEKGNLNSDSAIALSDHIKKSRLETARELVKVQQKSQDIQEKSDFAQRKLSELSSGPVRTERDAVIVVEKTNANAGKVRLNYLVDAAAWRPMYKLRAGKAAKDPVQIEYLAAVMQHTGEDWSTVKLVLSTAQPMLNAAPPELQTLHVTAAPQGSGPAVVHQPNAMEIEDQVKSLRGKAQKDLNERKQSSGQGLVNTAAALDQSFELLNPDAAVKRGCLLAVREGPSVVYHLNTKLTVPSRNDEQMLEVARLDMQPEYYYKAVPLLSSHVYRLADMTNKSNLVLLPGDATMYIGTDFVGQMTLPLVAIGEQFTAGFGIDPQVQVQRAMVDKSRSTHGANQSLKYDYRILVSNFKTEPVKLQVLDRLPHSENETVGVSLLKTAPELSKDALYLREERPNNLLRWDVTVEPGVSGEKAMAITYEFKLELDRQMTITNFKSAGIFGAPANPAPAGSLAHAPAPAMTAMSSMAPADRDKMKREMAKLSAEDRKAAETQFFCAIDQDSPLGTMGPILKVMVKGQPVFLCCKGCEAEAKAHPDETLVKLQQLMGRMSGKK
jgi:uncharacterized protein (TIGR02231 family)